MPTPDFVLELRRHVGTHPLPLVGVTAVIFRDDRVLLGRRSDDGALTPITGIVDPGEEPAVCAVREALEETGVEIRVDRLAMTSVSGEYTYPSGDRAIYLDTTFACSWVSGEPYVADDESVDVGWWPLDRLPDMGAWMSERVEAALSEECAARFRS